MAANQGNLSKNSRNLSSLRRCDGNCRLPCTHKKEGHQGIRHLYGFAPVPSPDLLNLFKVSTANPKYNSFRCYLLRSRPIKKDWVFAQRTRANVIKGCDLLP